MFTYQIRPRTLILDAREHPAWPADAVIELHLAPKQPFGTALGGGRTAVRNGGVSLIVNANNGQTEVENKIGLKPIESIVGWPDRRCELKGNVFAAKVRVKSLSDFESELLSVYHALPTLLNTVFADPPYVTHVAGTLNGAKFRWEVAGFRTSIKVTDQDEQEKLGCEAIVGLGTLAVEGRRRLLGALHYFHVACRLSRASATAGEFIAESLLNLAKTLEVLFPGNRDSAREQLALLGYSTAEIEAKFLPALLLRSKIDSAHVLLSLFTMDQLRTLHAYTLDVEDSFRELLARVLKKVKEGSYEPPRYEVKSVGSEVAGLIERMKATLPQDS